MSCLSKPYFIKLFKSNMKMAPLQYINRKKMEYAQFLLLSGNTSIKEIAHLLGFEDDSYFIRLFKRIMGETPGAYRIPKPMGE